MAPGRRPRRHPGPSGTYRPFDRTVAQVKEADVKAWLIGWKRSLKTKANYHGLLFGIFSYAVAQGCMAANPRTRTAPNRSRIRQSQEDLLFPPRRSSPSRPDSPAMTATSSAWRWEPACAGRALDLNRTPVDVAVQRVEVERPAGPELAIRRNGAGWTEAGHAQNRTLMAMCGRIVMCALTLAA